MNRFERNLANTILVLALLLFMLLPFLFSLTDDATNIFTHCISGAVYLHYKMAGF